MDRLSNATALLAWSETFVHIFYTWFRFVLIYQQLCALLFQAFDAHVVSYPISSSAHACLLLHREKGN